MEVICSPEDMNRWTEAERLGGRKIALVPTMGFFHEGHLSLMRHARKVADRVIVSLFVNPIQFGPNEDFDQYPRDEKRDRGLAEKEGVDVLFMPDVAAMYPSDHVTTVSVRQLTETLCGAKRPGHFNGVTTVVAKLFNLTKPDVAIFGEKDFQQLAVIRKMVNDLNFPVEIIGHPIVRESDGLAMSSRNVYLSQTERKTALYLSRILQEARQQTAAGQLNAKLIIDRAHELFDQAADAEIDYINIVDVSNLRSQQVINENSVMLLAVKVGKTRLIDNAKLMF